MRKQIRVPVLWLAVGAMCFVANGQPPAGPCATVVTPNGGEVFEIGDTMVITVDGDECGIATQVMLMLNIGRHSVQIGEYSFSPRIEPTHFLIIPGVITTSAGDEISPVSNECTICVADYNNPSVADWSDNAFSIVGGPSRVTQFEPRSIAGESVEPGAVYSIDGRLRIPAIVHDIRVKAGELPQGLYLVRTGGEVEMVSVKAGKRAHVERVSMLPQ
jgi:hypothetical protein